MSHRTMLGRAAVLASIAGLLIAGCNKSDDAVPNPTAADKNAASDHGFLGNPQVPTAEQVKAMEAMFAPKTPEPTPAQLATPPLAKSAAADVNVGFNDYGSLAQITDHAYASFADSYFQWVTPTAYAVVVPMQYGHFHLGY